MALEDCIGFYRARGHHVVHTASCWWYDPYSQRHLLYPFPLHRQIAPTKTEIQGLFRDNPGVWAVRFLGPDDGPGKKSYIWARRAPYDLSCLEAKSRNQTRRGLERCQVRPVTWEELLHSAWEAHQDTVQRHGKRPTATLGISTGLEHYPAFEAWAAMVDGNLAAYLVTEWLEDWVHIHIHRSANAYLKFYPNNALVFRVVEELLCRPGVVAVGYGWEPQMRLSSLDHFKLAMGFCQEPVRQRVLVAPWLRPLRNPLVGRAIRTASALRPKDERLRSLAALHRMACEG